MTPRLVAPLLAITSALALPACPHESADAPTSATEATSDNDLASTASTTSSTSTTSSSSTAPDLPTESAATDSLNPTAASTTDPSTSSTSTTDLSTTSLDPDTTAASPGACGDGLLDPGEECDDGDDNANDLYDGCTLACTLGPRCKDALVQPDHEECDPLDPNLVDEAACTDACTWGGRLVFVSSSTYTGALAGLTGADATCRALAKSAGLADPTGYRAWLSAGTASAASRIGDTGEPFILLDGQPIATSFASLTSGHLLHSIDLTELKTPVAAPLGAWTNTTSKGATASLVDDCAAWTNQDIDHIAVQGLTDATDPAWTHATPYYCSKQRHLYCIGS